MALPKNSKVASAEVETAGNDMFKARIRHTRIFCLLLIPLVAVTSPKWPMHSLPHELMAFWGHLLVSGGVLIRVFSSLYIGGRKNEALITEGPFSIVRNPLYVGSFLALTGLALVTGCVSFTAVLIVTFAVYYRVTVRREEFFLHRKFGARYRKYADRVPRWLPESNLWKLPERSLWKGHWEISVRPCFVLRSALDASVFLLIVPLLEGLFELRENGVVPTLLNLP